MFAAEGPQSAAHFAEEALTLVLVDAHDFVEQAEIVSTLAGDGAEGHHVFRKAGPAVADAGIQEARAYAGVGADAVADLIHVGAHGFADGRDRVDERNLHGEKRVGGVLDEFRALGAGDDDGSGGGSAVGWWNGVGVAVVAAAGERGIDFAHYAGAALVVAADEDAVGKKKVSDRGAFAQKLRVGGDVERFGVGAVAEDNFADPLAGVDRDRALLDDDFVSVDGAGNLACDRFDVREVGIATIGGGSTDGNEDGRTGAHGFLQIGGKFQTMSAVTAQQFRQEVFVDGDLPVFEGGQLAFVVVDENDVMATVGEAGASY